jgi:Flp pilus assembly protein TadG
VRCKKNESGVALVEFALILPFLAILVFGTIDLGRLYLLWNRVKNSAREGANYAQVNSGQQKPFGGNCSDPNNVQYRARSESGSSSSGFTITVTPTVPNGCDTLNPLTRGTNVTVTAQSSLTLLTPLLGQLVGSPLTVKSSVTQVVQ